MFLDDYYDYKKRDCYYYEEVQDMGAHIPTCKKYVSRDDVDKHVTPIIDERDNEAYDK